MLELRPSCEHCNKALPPASLEIPNAPSEVTNCYCSPRERRRAVSAHERCVQSG